MKTNHGLFSGKKYFPLGFAAVFLAAAFIFNACDTSGGDEAPKVTVTVTALNLTSLVPSPSADATPQTEFDNNQYTGTIAWQTSAGSPHTDKFTLATVYKAVVTLTAKSGYTFTGVSADAFTHSAATTVTNAANSGTVTIIFPSAGIKVNNAESYLRAQSGGVQSEDPVNLPITDILNSNNVGTIFTAIDSADKFVNLDLSGCTVEGKTLSLIGSLKIVEIILPACGLSFDKLSNAFRNVKTVSGNATEIRDDAFSGCTALTTVTLPAATSIGYDAFSGCTALTTVSLPQATEIGGNAFSGCTALTSVSLPAATKISGCNASNSGAFYGCTSLTSVSLPQATEIGYNAFSGCTALTSVSLPAATYIDGSTFYGCTALTSVSLPQATEIGEYAFSGCTALTTVSLPQATSVGGFSGCTSLTTVTLPAATKIDSGTFYGCTALTTVSLPQATKIGYQAFYGCTSLTTVSLPAATEIGTEAFKDTPFLTNFKARKIASITTLNDAAFISAFSDTFPKLQNVSDFFRGSTTLTSVSLPAATKISGGNTSNSGAFYGCTSLTTVSLPQATEIGEYAFSGCTALTSVSLPQATKIGEYAFSGCTALTTVSLPQATSVYGFYGCTALTTVSLPQATSVGGFSGCTSLTSVSLPQVTKIDYQAFYGCTALTTVSLPQATEIIDQAFSGCTSLTSVSLPMATEIGADAFSSTGGTALTIILGSRAPTLGDYMFSGVNVTKNVTIKKPVSSVGYSDAWSQPFKRKSSGGDRESMIGIRGSHN